MKQAYQAAVAKLQAAFRKQLQDAELHAAANAADARARAREDGAGMTTVRLHGGLHLLPKCSCGCEEERWLNAGLPRS